MIIAIDIVSALPAVIAELIVALQEGSMQGLNVCEGEGVLDDVAFICRSKR